MTYAPNGEPFDPREPTNRELVRHIAVQRARAEYRQAKSQAQAAESQRRLADMTRCTVCRQRTDTATRGPGALVVPLPDWHLMRVCSACRTVALAQLAERYGSEPTTDGRTRSEAVADVLAAALDSEAVTA